SGGAESGYRQGSRSARVARILRDGSVRGAARGTEGRTGDDRDERVGGAAEVTERNRAAGAAQTFAAGRQEPGSRLTSRSLSAPSLAARVRNAGRRRSCPPGGRDPPSRTSRTTMHDLAWRTS